MTDAEVKQAGQEFDAWLRSSGKDPDVFRGQAWLIVWEAAWKRAVAEEREACAVLAEGEYYENAGQARGLPEIHVLIRARSQAKASRTKEPR